MNRVFLDRCQGQETAQRGKDSDRIEKSDEDEKNDDDAADEKDRADAFEQGVNDHLNGKSFFCFRLCPYRRWDCPFVFTSKKRRAEDHQREIGSVMDGGERWAFFLGAEHGYGYGGKNKGGTDIGGIGQKTVSFFFGKSVFPAQTRDEGRAYRYTGGITGGQNKGCVSREPQQFFYRRAQHIPEEANT
ncbi:MAG: hypothetical protein ACI3W6_02820, partial [Clostridia bacterium]